MTIQKIKELLSLKFTEINRSTLTEQQKAGEFNLYLDTLLRVEILRIKERR